MRVARVQKLLKNMHMQEEKRKCISKEEILAAIDAGLKDLKAGRKQSFDDFIKEMEETI